MKFQDLRRKYRDVTAPAPLVLVFVVFWHKKKKNCTMVFESWETKFGVVVLHGNVKKLRTGLRNEKKNRRPTLSFCTLS